MTDPSGETRVTPQTLKGFQDYLPEAMAARDWVVGKIKAVFERYGFVQIDTPAIEHLEALIGTGGEETNKELFRLESPEGEAVALRFDLTVPYARLLAQYREQLHLPFRRYHIGPVFRADKPGPGRFRQFTQCDVDMAGASSVAVDAEVIAVMRDVMRAVGLVNEAGGANEFQVRVNDRRLVDALLCGSGVGNMETHKHILRVVDKLQKVGPDNVRKELGEGRIDDSGDPIRGVGLDARTIDGILAFIAVTGDTREAVVDAVADALPDADESRAAVDGLRELAACLAGLGVSELDVVFDPSLARGLDYYTGPVYEAVLPGAPECGSVMGGGRYDGLVSRFMDAAVPATGASIGLERFVEALGRCGKLPAERTTTKVMVVSTPGVPEVELLRVAAELRGAGIPTDVYIGDKKTGLGKQLSLANARHLPVAVIVGGSELAAGTISIKDLEAGMEKRKDIQDREQFRKAGTVSQVTVERAQLVDAVQDMLRR